MDIFNIRQFIKYVIFSRHRRGHGIHSPFVFNLVSHVFRNKIEPDIVFSIEKMRKKLISDPRLININDLGAGSKRAKTNQRKVSDITEIRQFLESMGSFLQICPKSLEAHLFWNLEHHLA
jgi:hypothetical protein